MAQNEPGVYGAARREETQDPNAGNIPRSVRTLPVPGISTGEGANFSQVGVHQQELAAALGSLGGEMDKLFENQKQDWRLEGQLAYAQGKTEQEIADTGNFYTVQGHRVLAAQTSMLEWYQQSQDEIAKSDQEIDTDTYRAKLMNNWKGITEALPDDRLVRQLAAQQSEALFPKLMQQQTAAHNQWNLRQQRTEWTNNLAVTSGLALQNVDEMPAAMKAMKERTAPGSSGLPKEMEDQALADAMTIDFQQGRQVLWDAVGGEEGLRERGMDAALVSGAIRARDNFDTQQQQDFAKNFNSEVDGIVASLGIDGNVGLAGQRLDALYSMAKENGALFRYGAEKTSQFAMVGAVTGAHPDWNPEQMSALMAKFNDPTNKRELSRMYADIRLGGVKGDRMTEVINDFSKRTGISPQDTVLAMKEYNRTIDQDYLKAAAQVKQAGAAQLKAETKAATLGNAWALGNLHTSGATPGDIQDTMETQMQAAIGTAYGMVARGEQPKNAMGQPISPEQWAEGEVLKKARGMNLIMDSAATAVQASLTASVIDPVTKQVTPQALESMEFLKRLENEYGYSPAQVQKYLGGDAKSSSYAARLYYTARDFDNGGDDTATSLRLAQMQLDPTTAVTPEMLQQKTKTDVIDKVIKDKIGSGFWSDVSRIYDGIDEGGFLYGFFGHTRDEFARMADDPVLTNAVRNRVQVELLRNPRMSGEAATKMAMDNIMGRGTIVGDSLILASDGSTVLEDMGIPTGGPDTAHFAMLNYLREYASKPVSEGGFGESWLEFKVAGDAENGGIFTGQFWENLAPGTMVDQVSESVVAQIRGAPHFRTRYDEEQKVFYVSDYDSQDADRDTGRIMVIPAAEIGKAYNAWYAKDDQARRDFWGKVQIINPPLKQDPIKPTMDDKSWLQNNGTTK